MPITVALPVFASPNILFAFLQANAKLAVAAAALGAVAGVTYSHNVLAAAPAVDYAALEKVQNSK